MTALEDFLVACGDSDVPLGERLQAARNLLLSKPVLADFFGEGPVLRQLRQLAVGPPGVDHVGFGSGGKFWNDELIRHQGQLSRFEITKTFPSCQAPNRKMVRLVGPGGQVEIAIDAHYYVTPHLAWRVAGAKHLMEVGEVLKGTMFQPPDSLRNCILFNRDESVMFRYFNGAHAGRPVTLEFCW